MLQALAFRADTDNAHSASALATIDMYAVHLSEKHKIPTTKVSLVPFALGECPFCLKYFTSARGWAKHTSSCKERGPLDPTVSFPKQLIKSGIRARLEVSLLSTLLLTL